MHASAVTVFSAFVFTTSLQAAQRITREQTARMILEGYAIRDSAGYLSSHSSFYPRMFATALAGDMPALRRVFRDPLFHSGDNEAWCSIPGAILYVLGDARFSSFAMSLPPADRFWALTYIPTGRAVSASRFFECQFPKTYRLYVESDARPGPNQAMQRTAR